MSGWSLQAQLERVQAKEARLARKTIHDVIVQAGGDPISAVGLHTIDNYRPDWEPDTDDFERVFSSEAILEWSQANFPLEA